MSEQSNTKYLNIFLDRIIPDNATCNTILSCCCPADIIALSRTCKGVRPKTMCFMTRAYDINHHLLRFFDEPTKFRSLQARTGTLISGSFALQFFDRTVYPESDLDLYVHLPRRKEVGHWLLAEGYSFAPNTKQDPDFDNAVDDERILVRDGIYTMRGVAAVFTFTKKVRDTETECKVQLVIGSNSPMEIILSFHSTCVMNVISYEKAYSLYPRATFKERRSLVCATDGPKQEPAIEKYSARGWQMLRKLSRKERRSTNCSFRGGSRWIADHDSWVIELDLAGVDLSPALSSASLPLVCDPVAVTNWTLQFSNYEPHGMEFTVVSTDKLYYE
ncbi:uncharacterized protein LAESUDRAFT_700451 [Laetiporus sulphureus 93-53]|uniref:Uncharacterized protein n=1 Tax=Laetiporus sulphureus 93-53 TaxID=1314785 RepID=A0A165E9Z2_9APHY|nr:uncharacterized protein LAESUDRAFT_700451 [Laetiporus sulphureus 93-53]KZT06562.1 hypothetical protein LAESUDRAFT_700451 [Laetiporus sulphureus 93-53]